MEVTWAIIIVVSVIVIWFLWKKQQCKEGMGGYGVTSSLFFNNRIAYCDKGNEAEGGSYAGGCFLAHRVIL